MRIAMQMITLDKPKAAKPKVDRVTYDTNVFSSIADRALHAVAGVRAANANKHLFQRLGKGRSIRCRETRQGLIFDVSVVARRGATIHDLCRSVQEAIAAAVLKMTNRSDVVVNVSVRGVV
jgi:uncharacterized alkaline shock family protein YloU